MHMDLLTPAQAKALGENHINRVDNAIPVVKLFTPDAAATWLLCSMDSEGRCFGLCDLGLGFPELGHVSLASLMDLRGPSGQPVERDLHFEGSKPIMDYWQEARALGRIEA